MKSIYKYGIFVVFFVNYASLFTQVILDKKSLNSSVKWMSQDPLKNMSLLKDDDLKYRLRKVEEGMILPLAEVIRDREALKKEYNEIKQNFFAKQSHALAYLEVMEMIEDAIAERKKNKGDNLENEDKKYIEKGEELVSSLNKKLIPIIIEKLHFQKALEEKGSFLLKKGYQEHFMLNQFKKVFIWQYYIDIKKNVNNFVIASEQAKEVKNQFDFPNCN